MDEPRAQAAPGTAGSLKSVDRAVAVLHALESHSAVTLAEASRRAGLSEATTLRYLTSLVGHGLVERAGAGGYRLGWELFRLGQLVLPGRFPRELVLRTLHQLRNRFEETVNFATRQGDELVIVEAVEGPHSIRRAGEVGQRDPWHASALGKAMLAAMPAEERDTLLSRCGCPSLTANTITDRARLEAELQAVHAQGYATDREETVDGLICVGAAISAPDGRPAYAMSVCFVSQRVRAPEDLAAAGEVVHIAANQLGEVLDAAGAQL